MARSENTMEIRWQVYSNTEELPEDHKELLNAAQKALDKAYAPYSKFQVGAAVRLDNGEILSGANFENAAYPMCLCAERTTLATVVSTQPEAVVKQMAIRVRNPERPVQEPAAPCGACRQVLVETEGRQQADIQILLQGETGPVYVLSSAKMLLPLYFDGSFL